MTHDLVVTYEPPNLITADLIPNSSFNFNNKNGKPVLILNFNTDPPSVWIDPDLSWDIASKHFWNSVHRIVGKMAPFPEIG
jgi:hypothetical protein